MKIKLKTAAWLMILASAMAWEVEALAQANVPKNVAIFLYEGVELLDFAGPGEVFSASGFNVYTVSVDGKELKSQRFLSVKPGYSIETAPPADIVVFPGGHTQPSAYDARVVNWAVNRHEQGAILLSVCTGAMILAKADMLN